jgi:hypothetical protein
MRLQGFQVLEFHPVSGGGLREVAPRAGRLSRAVAARSRG